MPLRLALFNVGRTVKALYDRNVNIFYDMKVGKK